jgi:GDPmannose 4,6-dehydratase
MLQQKNPDDYVLATNETHTVREFVNEACKVADITNLKIKTDKKYMRPIDVQYLRGDYSKSRKKLGWKPKTLFKQLVKIMVEEDINRWEKWLKKEYQPWDAAISGEDSNVISNIR